MIHDDPSQTRFPDALDPEATQPPEDDWLWDALNVERQIEQGRLGDGGNTVERLHHDLHRVLHSVIEQGADAEGSRRRRPWYRRPPVVGLVLGTVAVAVAGSWLWSLALSQSAQDFARRERELDAIEREAELAVPAWPEREAHLADLTERVRSLVRELPEVEHRAASLAGADRSGGERSAARPPHFLADWLPGARSQLASLGRELERLGNQPSERERREHTVEQIAALKAQLTRAERRVARSDGVVLPPARLDEFDAVDTQAERLRFLSNYLLPDLTYRLAWSRVVRAQTVEVYAQRWQELAERMRRQELYRESIPPQLGLVPLGPDPATGLEEFGHVLSGAIAFREAGAAIEPDATHGIVFVLVPGRPDAGSPAELPPFFLAKHRLSRAQWSTLARDLPRFQLPDAETEPREPRHDATGMTWQVGCDLLARHGLRIPSIDEWQHATTALDAFRASFDGAGEWCVADGDGAAPSVQRVGPSVPALIGLRPARSVYASAAAGGLREAR